jgi:hypothetical protein
MIQNHGSSQLDYYQSHVDFFEQSAISVPAECLSFEEEEAQIIFEGWPVQLDVVIENVRLFVFLSNEIALTLRIKRRPTDHFWVEYLSVFAIPKI